VCVPIIRRQAQEKIMPDIGIPLLLLSLAPILALAWISHQWARSAWETAYATLRMLVQLLAVGFALVFVFKSPTPLVGGAVTLLMVAIASLIGIRTIQTNRLAAYVKALVSIGVTGALILAFILFGVLQLSDPAYQPRVMIPFAGMIFSNAMTAITLAAERLQRELETGTPYKDARTAAWTAALIPQINALLAVGLVSLPGMMTGQVLTGVDPLIAVRYQIVVMAMIFQSAGFSVAMFLLLSGRAWTGRETAEAEAAQH
jgi:putative ABC transport system permease protein